MSKKTNNKINKYHVLAGLLAYLFLGGLGSCGKYLDVTPENVGTIDYAFRNRNEAENYLFACYNTLQSLNSQINDPGFITSGEIYNDSYSENLEWNPNFLIITGTQNTNSPILNYWEGSNAGVDIFKGIRRCNIMLDNIDKPVDLTAFEKERWVAELNFLKAYYHYYLLRLYGPIPIMDNADDISQSVDVFRQKRRHADTVFTYITQLLDESVSSLPATIDNPAEEMGRITQTIALGVKAEVLALQASPLFNGNPDYTAYTDKDGVALFAATADNNKWQKAAEAAKAAIDHAEGAGHELYSFIAPAVVPAGISDSLKLGLTLQNAVTERWELNREVIWALNGFVSYQQNYMPRFTPVRGNGHHNIGVPIAVTELFFTENGVPIEEDKTWPYEQRFALQTAESHDRYYIKENYTTVRANFNREPRYYAHIAFDGSAWYGGGVLNPNSMHYVQAKRGDIGGAFELPRANLTGYWPKKLVHYLTAINTSNGNVTINNYRMPRLRLSDLYLLYAECLNEANGPSEEVYHYIDRVRERAGLDGVVESWAEYSSNPNKPQVKEGLRSIIQQERRIELMFEGKAGYDLRRWKEYVTEASKPIQGWNIMQEDINAYYTVQTYVLPPITNKDYFWPISNNEMLRNDQLIQSPFWR